MLFSANDKNSLSLKYVLISYWRWNEQIPRCTVWSKYQIKCIYDYTLHGQKKKDSRMHIRFQSELCQKLSCIYESLYHVWYLLIFFFLKNVSSTEIAFLTRPEFLIDRPKTINTYLKFSFSYSQDKSQIPDYFL